MSQREWPYYGPHGDPESPDPFEWMQARAPEGWHVEGQFLGRWEARSLEGDILRAPTPTALVDKMQGAAR